MLVLDTADPSEYSDGVILKRGRSASACSTLMFRFPKRLPKRVSNTSAIAKVDLVVCISSVRTYVRNLPGRRHRDHAAGEEVSTMGGNSNGSFFVNAPHMDSVGAILVSPSNVVSAKVIESL